MTVRYTLELEHVSRSFGAAVAVNDLSLAVESGERRVILGANGAGKSTLFNLISGDLHPSSGHIVFLGRNINRLPTQSRIRLGVHRTYQTSLPFAGLTVRECLFLALRGAGNQRFTMIRRATDCSEMDEAGRAGWRAGLSGALDTLAGELSHGEARQLEIAMASVGEPHLLLLDEPAAGLSMIERARLLDTLRMLPRSVTLLMIEHDVELALAIADKVTFMHNGLLVTEGTPQEIASSREVHDIYMGHHAL